MRFSKVHTISDNDRDAIIVSVETDVGRGLYHFAIVGLPDKAVAESRDRISAAIKNSGFDSPKTKQHKITSSLIPAHVKKSGSSFDLPIALSYLNAIGTIQNIPSDLFFLGELSLDGSIRSIKYALRTIFRAYNIGARKIFIPNEDKEAVFSLTTEFPDLLIFPAKNLEEVVLHLNGGENISPLHESDVLEAKSLSKQIAHKNASQGLNVTSLENIVGQECAKRGALIAIAGGHHMLLNGPPGTGKTLLAQACQTLLPNLSNHAAIELSTIFNPSGMGHESDAAFSAAPFRAPHHTSSYSSVIGSSSRSVPGEISRAHRGILLLDELPEFDRRVIESLREPMEEGQVRLSGQNGSFILPARAIIIATANPCPCGYRGTEIKRCICRPLDIKNYERKLSGPFIDRIDIFISMSTTLTNKNTKKILNSNQEGVLTTQAAKEKIINARKIQSERYAKTGSPDTLNASIKLEDIPAFIHLDNKSNEILEQGIKNLNLSMRGKHRVLKVARTIADLDGSMNVKAPHILEALSFRQKE